MPASEPPGPQRPQNHRLSEVKSIVGHGDVGRRSKLGLNPTLQLTSLRLSQSEPQFPHLCNKGSHTLLHKVHGRIKGDNLFERVIWKRRGLEIFEVAKRPLWEFQAVSAVYEGKR